MNARERYLMSRPFAVLKECDFTRANRAWLALPLKFRTFIAKQAGLSPARGEVSLDELLPEERKRLHEANARLVDLAVNASAPLLTAAVMDPPLPARMAA